MHNTSATSEPESTRARIIAVADQLFYEKGFEASSFADIAGEVGLSRGNFYYHFRTKDDILQAVIQRRMKNTRSMLAAWEEEGKIPAERIMCFVHILIINGAKIIAHGCPVGTLCNELAKLDHGALGDASAVFNLFREWLAGQFSALGHGKDADALAMHLLMRSQGVATLATAFGDQDFIAREVEAIRQWLSGLAAPRAEGDPPFSSSS